MTLAGQFLRQARSLSRTAGPGRPQQINLRRSISAAYYAVFHLLINCAVESSVPAVPNGLRARAARALQHGELKNMCRDFSGANPPKVLATVLPVTLSGDLRTIAKNFTDLQEARHAADYDTSLKLSQTDALAAVQQAEQAFQCWQTIQGTDEANVFLSALVFGARWNR